MRALVSLLLAVAIVAGIYYFYLRRVQPSGPGSVPTQAISITGVQNDLLVIAQAERIYFAQHGSYASLNELAATGALTVAPSGRDGYTYSVETTPGGFIVTARRTAQPPSSPGGAPSLHYPTITVNENMQIRRID